MSSVYTQFVMIWNHAVHSSVWNCPWTRHGHGVCPYLGQGQDKTKFFLPFWTKTRQDKIHKGWTRDFCPFLPHRNLSFFATDLAQNDASVTRLFCVSATLRCCLCQIAKMRVSIKVILKLYCWFYLIWHSKETWKGFRISWTRTRLDNTRCPKLGQDKNF